ncbi:unnamed protein product [Adineta ricciae]|nr:unnamed protein product [Adineta ricciae]
MAQAIGAREEQWVSRVVDYSSQYNNDTWAAHQIIGPPKVYPRYGDLNGAWAQGNRANNEFIVIEFSRAVNPEQIDIYETYNAGAVVKVGVRNGGHPNADWETIWQVNSPHVEARSRIFSIPCSNKISYGINQIRLEVNCTAAGSWCEIDCVKLIGHSSYHDIAHRELIMNLKQFLKDDCLADVVFQLDGGQTISAYRNLLRTRCHYFSLLFDEHGTNTETPIPIGNISYDAFYQILNYTYTETIDSTLNYEVYLELMRKADEYYLSPIYDDAFGFIKKLVNSRNVLKIYLSACSPIDAEGNPTLILTDVIDYCVGFVQRHRQEVYKSDEMHLLPKDMLLKLVQLVL